LKDIRNTKPVLLSYIHDEKTKFEHTLESGFKRVASSLSHQDVQWVSGRDVLLFEKEFGLPLPMLTRFLTQQKISFNPKAYDAARELWEWEEVESHS